MIHLRVFQYNPTSIYSVYKFTNFLKEDYLQLLTEKTLSLTEKDHMNRATNVKANMTDYRELLSHPEYKDFFELAAQQFLMIVALKTPHVCDKITVRYEEAWGMKHNKGDFTDLHWHYATGNTWSGVFCLKTPAENQEQDWIHFADFNVRDRIEANSLYLFHSFVKHEVSAHHSEEPRISISFNMETSSNKS
jgi:hypothetical protein|tara:strand:- start:852 stop:1427 length:576 start_codon:yes stop_codon:yes gene_type:complete